MRARTDPGSSPCDGGGGIGSQHQVADSDGASPSPAPPPAAKMGSSGGQEEQLQMASMNHHTEAAAAPGGGGRGDDGCAWACYALQQQQQQAAMMQMQMQAAQPDGSAAAVAFMGGCLPWHPFNMYQGPAMMQLQQNWANMRWVPPSPPFSPSVWRFVCIEKSLSPLMCPPPCPPMADALSTTPSHAKTAAQTH